MQPLCKQAACQTAFREYYAVNVNGIVANGFILSQDGAQSRQWGLPRTDPSFESLPQR